MIFTGKALIIDDEPHVRKYIGLILRSIGATSIIEASDGAEGFVVYQKERPDLVLLDVNMPVQNGIETLKQIRSANADALVVMLTSLTLRQTVEEAVEGGALHYIRKDMAREELVALLKDLLTEDSEPKTS